mgnify:CR=1 FL=1
MPERRLLSLLDKKRIISLSDAQKESGLTPDEFKASLGALKKKSLIDLNCDVTLVANLEPKDFIIAKQSGAKLASLSEPPGFRSGDGQFSINTENGPMLSEVGKMYKLGMVPYDIIYVDNEQIFKAYGKMYDECKIVDIESKEYYLCDKTPEGYKEFFVKMFNHE